VASKQNLTILQGETFNKVLRWEVLPLVYVPITAITQAAPASLTVTGHGITDGWRAAITCVVGMKEINADHDPPWPSEYHRVTVVDPNTLELNAVNASCYTAYVSGGILQYYTAASLSGFTARMKIRASVSSATVLLELTDANFGIILDDAAKTIVLNITATDTALITWKTAVYDLELVSGAGVVTRLIEGRITVSREVTRD